jgi:hypothetical protein
MKVFIDKNHTIARDIAVGECFMSGENVYVVVKRGPLIKDMVTSASHIICLRVHSGELVEFHGESNVTPASSELVVSPR